MNINNYSYTSPDNTVNVNCIANVEDLSRRGYLMLTLEQWGTDPNEKNYIVSGFWNGADIDATISADASEGWETLRHSYEIAARIYNSLVDDSEIIPLF